ncbi:MAG: class I SAM-dependent methyltransferase [Elusimicrobia bacterium]|nr:class I SAM-dependent methyltransferase [Elusimicrobiota bacterium]
MSVACNLCGRDDSETWGRPKDGLRLVRCRNCGLIYVNPRPTPEALADYYRKDYFEGGNYAEDVLRERMYRMEIARMLPWIGSRGRFLDVGCAMGKFLSVLPDTFEKRGVEFSSDAVRHARESFGLDVRVGQLSEVGIERGHYDVVQMRGVIEHLQDPRREVREVRLALKPKGWFVLNQTPDLGGLAGCLYRERHNQVKPREHLYYFTKATLSRLLTEEGFIVRNVWRPYWGTPYAAPWRDFPVFLFNLVSGRECPAFPGNMIAVYAQKVD